MRILWLCNHIPPMLAGALDLKTSAGGGWFDAALRALQNTRECPEICLCAPSSQLEKWQCGSVNGMQYRLFPRFMHEQSLQLQKGFSDCLKEFAPDIVHIFGTEYMQTLSMMKACAEHDLLDQTLVHIQGLVSVYTQNYCANIPKEQARKRTLRDILKREGILAGQKSFQKRGKAEQEALQLAKHISGRTDWDRACTQQINPTAQYHFCNETLRPSFYRNTWRLSECKKHSVFISQCSYPIKGLHLFLDAMPELIRRYPDLHVFTTGRSPMVKTLRGKLMQTSYARYLRKKILALGLEQHITFLGMLSEEEMCHQYTQAHVFLSPSSIENSPNSVGEAMLLGVPTVASHVGGTANMLKDAEEGFLYPFDEPYMIAYYIGKIFEDDALAQRLSASAKAHAQKTHSPEQNANTLLDIYKELQT